MATRRKGLYDEDSYQWSREQAAALRRLAAERSGRRRVQLNALSA
jgi:hypothetical protein